MSTGTKSSSVKAKKNLREKGKITQPALHRIIYRSGVPRVQKDCFDELRNELDNLSAEILVKMLVFTKNNERKTVKVEDLESSLRILGIDLVAGRTTGSKLTTKELKSCVSVRKTSHRSKKPKSEGSKRAKPGTLAKREILFQQKHGGCLAIPNTNFSNRIRRMVVDNKLSSISVRFSEDVLGLFQLTIETYLIRLTKAAYEITKASGRTTIASQDFKTVKKIWDLKLGN